MTLKCFAWKSVKFTIIQTYMRPTVRWDFIKFRLLSLARYPIKKTRKLNLFYYVTWDNRLVLLHGIKSPTIFQKIFSQFSTYLLIPNMCNIYANFITYISQKYIAIHYIYTFVFKIKFVEQDQAHMYCSKRNCL